MRPRRHDLPITRPWALVPGTHAIDGYSLVEVTRRTKRFTEFRHSSGMEGRTTTRGLWDFETREAAEAELAKLEQIWRAPIALSLRPPDMSVSPKDQGEIGRLAADAGWRSVAGFPDYWVHSDGRVFSLHSDAYLRPYEVKGYLKVSLHGGGRRRVASVHLLVAEAFHGPRPDGLECAHLDGNAKNNCADNLAWVTKQENEAQKIAHGTAIAGEKSHHAKLTNAQAEIVRAAFRRPLKRRELGELVGVSETAIEQLLRGDTYNG